MLLNKDDDNLVSLTFGAAWINLSSECGVDNRDQRRPDLSRRHDRTLEESTCSNRFR